MSRDTEFNSRVRDGNECERAGAQPGLISLATGFESQARNWQQFVLLLKGLVV